MEKKFKAENSVYCFMDHANGICKIGLSGDPAKRIKSLQNSNPIKLDYRVIYVLHMSEAESYLHRVFSRRRIHGEWFKGVSFEEFEYHANMYIKMKDRQPLNSIEFYKFLYNTDYEMDKGIPLAFSDRFKRMEYTFMIFMDRDFSSVKLFTQKLNYLLSNIDKRCPVKLLCPNRYLHNMVKKYLDKSQNNYSSYCFPDKYYGDWENFTELCLDAVEDCYGLIVFCKSENYLIGKLINHAKSRGTRVKIVKQEQEAKIIKLKVA